MCCARIPHPNGINIMRNSSSVQNPINSGSSRCLGIEYWSKGRLRQFGGGCVSRGNQQAASRGESPIEKSDRTGNRRGDDRHARAGTDAHTNRDRDLAKRKATGGKRHDAAGKRQHGDDLTALAFEEVGELRQRGIERGVGTGHRGVDSEYAHPGYCSQSDGKVRAALLEVECFHCLSLLV